MVKETRIMFTFSDITGIRIKCGACPYEVILHPGPDYINLPESCALCGHSWLTGARGIDRIQRLINLLGEITETDAHPAVKVRLEIQESE